MTEMLLNWVADTLARSDIIDLYFMVSDLVEIPLREAETYETAHYDAFASATVQAHQKGRQKVPLGKLVL